MLQLPVSFSIFYGLAFSNLANERDGSPFDPSKVDLAPYLDDAAQILEEYGTENREFSLIRPWLELLIASSHADVRAFGIRGVQGLPDIVLPHPGVDALPIGEWHHVLEYVRQKLYHLDGPMTDEDKARVKREVTISNADVRLEDFRARRSAEGLLDPE